MRAIVTAVSALVLAGCAAGTTTGFAFDTPDGWADRTGEAEVKSGRKEYELVLSPSDHDGRGLPPTLTVSRAKVRDGDTLADVVRVQRKDAVPAEPTEAAERTLGGKPALTYDFAADGRRGRTVVAIHDAHVYGVSLVADTADFGPAESVLEDVAGSWRWERETAG